MGVLTTINVQDAAGVVKTMRVYSEANDGSGPYRHVYHEILGDADNGFWSYAADAAGIVNTTGGVVLRGTAGAGIRAYINSIQLTWDTLGAATQVVIREGAAGAVLWRGKIGTSAGSREIVFARALKGSPNTEIQFATLTAVTGAVFVNAQGHTGA